jgi:hypothetical protein
MDMFLRHIAVTRQDVDDATLRYNCGTVNRLPTDDTRNTRNILMALMIISIQLAETKRSRYE